MRKIILDTRARGMYSVCDYHRIVIPYKRNLDINPKHDVFIFNGVPTKGKQGFLALKNLGFKIVMDLDDSLNLPENHIFSSMFDKSLREDLKWFLEKSDLVTTTTNALQREFSQYNDNVHVVPNGLPFDEGQFTISHNKYSKSPLVWAGSETHKADLAHLPNFGDKLTLCGFRQDNEKLSSDEWRLIRSKIQPDAKYEAIRPYESYMQSYDGHQIAIAPLANNELNNAKSNLKILEAGAKGLPIICSKRENYFTPEVEDIVIYAETTREWREWAEYLMNNPDICSQKGKDLAEYVRNNYHIDDINMKRKTLIEDL